MWSMQGLICPTLGKTEPLIAPAKGTSIFASAIPHTAKMKGGSGKDYFECAGKIEISVVEFLSAGETGKA